MKKNILPFNLLVTGLLLVISFFSNAQQSGPDTLTNARVTSVNGTTTYDGTGAGTSGIEGTYVGYNSGRITTGKWNSFLGANSGYSNTTGDRNIFVGGSSGYSNSTGKFNTFTGFASGASNTIGSYNVFNGLSAGGGNTTGSFNVYLGYGAYNNNTVGQNNIGIGHLSGNNNTSGIGNVFVGYKAGFFEMGSNKLYIANSDTINPLIKGDFAAKNLVFNGKVGVGTSTFPTSVGSANVSTYQLFVKGGILTNEIRIRTGWADYVFDNSYILKDLYQVEKFIKSNGHLPNIPSSTEVEEQGLSLGDIARLQQEKIEEITLYLIEQKKKSDQNSKEMNLLKDEITQLKSLVKQLVERK